MFESIFQFFFKYRPLLFGEGELTLSAPWPVVGVLLVGLVVVIPALLSYTRTKGKSGVSDRRVLAGLRLALLLVLLVCLMQPSLVLTSVVPERNFLAVLVDDSRSMQIQDDGAIPRNAFVTETFGAEGSDLLEQLSEEYSLRYFRFASGTDRLESMADLNYTGTGTHLGQALDHAREELAGVPLSGILVLTDGADNSDALLAESVVPLQAQGTPVYTVGLGEEVLERDIQLGRIDTPRSVLQGASVGVDFLVTQNGFSGRTVAVQVEDEGRIVATEEVELSGNGEPVSVRLRFTLEEEGPRRIRFHLPPQEGEMVEENNTREVLVQVTDKREKVLYLEGEPRFEVKFIRRAVTDDDNLQVVVLQRTADGKFLRLDVDDGEELVGGFPTTREELFQYRALILGSVEASFFTHDQLQMISDFVSERGGGLIALGGRNAFAQGGYTGTPVEDALPVILEDAPVTGPDRYFQLLKVEPTRSGLLHSALQIAGSEEATKALWEALPEVSTANPLSELKPGAVALLTAENPDVSGREQIVLATHRYGRGRAAAFVTQDSWRWQMHADVPLEDLSHETLWRQLIRWAVDGTPDGVMADFPEDRVAPGSVARLVAHVADSAYAAVNNAEVTARIISPIADIDELPLNWTVEEDGRYEATFLPTEEGLYEIDITATREGETIGSASAFINAAVESQEFFDPGMRSSLLRRVAEETGGRFYTPETVSSLPEDISVTGAGVTVIEERDLWDMPIFFILMLAIMASEWAYRRTKGLA